VRTLLTALLAAATLAGVAGAGGARDGHVLAVEWVAGGGQLRWVSARTLDPVGSQTGNVGGAPAIVAARSPDGSALAIGGGDGGRLRIVDLQSLRTIALIRLGGGFVSHAIWRTANRMHVLHPGVPNQVVTLDPEAGRILERRTFDGAVLDSLPAGKRVVALVAPSGSIGPAHLAVVNADGSVRTIRLLGISAGIVPTRSSNARTPVARQLFPGLTVSPDGQQAAVVAQQRIVKVDLATLDQRVVKLATRGLTAATKVPLTGSQRQAIWLADGRFAVVTHNYVLRDHRVVAATTGLRLLDLEQQTLQTLDESATAATLVGDTLLAHGGSALRGFTLGGKLRFETPFEHSTSFVQTAGNHAYVGRWNGTSQFDLTIVDVEAGRVVGRVQTGKTLVILDPSP
jgi:hypothetical protein